MSEWKKGDRCVAVCDLQFRVPGWCNGYGDMAIVNVKKGIEGQVHDVTLGGLMVVWEEASTEDPDAAMKMMTPILTLAAHCRGVTS